MVLVRDPRKMAMPPGTGGEAGAGKQITDPNLTVGPDALSPCQLHCQPSQLCTAVEAVVSLCLSLNPPGLISPLGALKVLASR